MKVAQIRARLVVIPYAAVVLIGWLDAFSFVKLSLHKVILSLLNQSPVLRFARLLKRDNRDCSVDCSHVFRIDRAVGLREGRNVFERFVSIGLVFLPIAWLFHKRQGGQSRDAFMHIPRAVWFLILSKVFQTFVKTFLRVSACR